MRNETEILNAVLKELHGIDHEIEYGRHIKVRFKAHGRQQMVVLARSTGEWHAIKNAVCNVRRILRGGHL